jgi:hypothetical protein
VPLSGTRCLARITAQEERIEVEGQEAGGVILATPLRILNPSIVSAGMEAEGAPLALPRGHFVRARDGMAAGFDNDFESIGRSSVPTGRPIEVRRIGHSEESARAI